MGRFAEPSSEGTSAAALLQQHPEYVMVLFAVAVIACNLGQVSTATFQLTEALQHASDWAAAPLHLQQQLLCYSSAFLLLPPCLDSEAVGYNLMLSTCCLN